MLLIIYSFLASVEYTLPLSVCSLLPYYSSDSLTFSWKHITSAIHQVYCHELKLQDNLSFNPHWRYHIHKVSPNMTVTFTTTLLRSISINKVIISLTIYRYIDWLKYSIKVLSVNNIYNSLEKTMHIIIAFIKMVKNWNLN